MPTLSQWQHTWEALGADQSHSTIPIFDVVIAKYSEPQRHYHTLQHLTECLDNFVQLRDIANNPDEIALALWFHDVIYDPTRHDNEVVSANWARSCVINAGLTIAIAERIYNLVMATQHHTKTEDLDTKILIDVDLAILGATPERFDEYEQQIRQEYSHVPERLFQQKRAEILQRFLAQATIFNTALFIDRYQQQAQLNIKHALEQLCSS
jgi:predicted metal-dependent HD superfamily phosphohydrolase